MENKKSGPAEKGSRFCLQQYIEKDKDRLSKSIIVSSFSLMSFLDKDLKITWKSPIKGNDFDEYRDGFLKSLGFNIVIDDAEKQLRNFWPKNGPQWDGIAVADGKENSKGLLLLMMVHIKKQPLMSGCSTIIH